MKQLFFSVFLLCATIATAQDVKPRKSISIYGGPGAYLDNHNAVSGYNAPGIQQDFKSNPFVFGADYTREWRNGLHYVVSAQGALQYTTSVTTIQAPQKLPPNISRIDSQSDNLEAVQFMLGGGLRYQAIKRKWLILSGQFGLFGSYIQDRDATPGQIGLLVGDPNNLTWEYAGTIDDEINRQFIPVLQYGIIAQVPLSFCPRLSVGVDAFYYTSRYFLRGSWSRVNTETSLPVTLGGYRYRWDNLVGALRLTYQI